MDKIKSLFSKRHNFLYRFKLHTYNKYPVYKTPQQPKQRIDQLLLMRDLRLWVIENIPHSKFHRQYYTNIEHLTREIRELEGERGLTRLLIYAGFVFFAYYSLSDESLRRNQATTWYDIPLLQQETRGGSTLHMGETLHPKSEQEDRDIWFKTYIK